MKNDDSSGCEEKQRLIGDETSKGLPVNITESKTNNNNVVPELRVYRRRWWIILTFFLCSTAQSAHWNAWSPISDAVQIAYNWDDTVVTTFPAISNGTTVLLGFLIMSIIETKGKKYLSTKRNIGV